MDVVTDATIILIKRQATSNTVAKGFGSLFQGIRVFLRKSLNHWGIRQKKEMKSSRKLIIRCLIGLRWNLVRSSAMLMEVLTGKRW